jgi:hypothetical protein
MYLTVKQKVSRISYKQHQILKELSKAAEVKNAEDTIKKIGGDKVSDSGIGNPPKEEREPSSGGGGYTPPVEPDTYTLTLKASPIKGGTVTGSGKYKKGAKIPVTATAAEGYKFINWTTGEEEVSTEAAFTYTMPAEAVTLIANFGEVVVEPGTPVTLEINPMKAKIGDEIALNGNTGPNRLISIKVVDSKGKIVYFDGVKSSGDGKYNTTFKVPDGGDGDLTIVAGYGENVATKVLKIKK